MTKYLLSNLRGIFAVIVLVLVCAAGFVVVKKAAARQMSNSDVSFWAEITGSDKDGFDLFAANPDETERKCKASVRVTMNDGSTKSFTYERTVRKTDKMSFGGEAGLKPAPISDVSITSKGCEQ